MLPPVRPVPDTRYLETLRDSRKSPGLGSASHRCAPDPAPVLRSDDQPHFQRASEALHTDGYMKHDACSHVCRDLRERDATHDKWLP